jgi:hypothetical protein
MQAAHGTVARGGRPSTVTGGSARQRPTLYPQCALVRSGPLPPQVLWGRRCVLAVARWASARHGDCGARAGAATPSDGSAAPARRGRDGASRTRRVARRLSFRACGRLPANRPRQQVRRTVAAGRWRVRDRAASSGRYPRCGTAPAAVLPADGAAARTHATVRRARVSHRLMLTFRVSCRGSACGARALPLPRQATGSGARARPGCSRQPSARRGNHAPACSPAAPRPGARTRCGRVDLVRGAWRGGSGACDAPAHW